jgi:hypothetical protein
VPGAEGVEGRHGLVGSKVRLSPKPTVYRQTALPVAKRDHPSGGALGGDGGPWGFRSGPLVTSCRAMSMLLVHVGDGERRVVDSSTVYYAEAVGGDTVVRRRGAKPLHDVRELGDIERAWKRHGFVRIHDNHLVHPDHILWIRKRTSRSWEVTMAPPVNAVLSVSRNRLAALWAAFEG